MKNASVKKLRPFFRKKYIPLVVLLPNMITLSSLFMGMLAIKFASESQHIYAVNLILAAALLDSLDGRVARMLKGTSRFGAELDSLADMVNFGIAPAFTIYTFFLQETSYGWLSVYIYSISVAMRLARFNIELSDDERPKWLKDYFVGVPAPAGALLSLLPFYLTFAIGGSLDFGIFSSLDFGFIDYSSVISLYIVLIGCLMVSSLRTFSGKFEGRTVHRSYIPAMFFLIIFVISVIYLYYWDSLYTISILYILHIPLGHLHYLRRYRSWHSGVG